MRKNKIAEKVFKVSDYLEPHEVDVVEVISLIIRERKSQGITQRGLAKKSGVTQANLSRIENFEVSPSFETISKLLGSLGIKIKYEAQESR